MKLDTTRRFTHSGTFRYKGEVCEFRLKSMFRALGEGEIRRRIIEEIIPKPHGGTEDVHQLRVETYALPNEI